jgi:hypothetical protein
MNENFNRIMGTNVGTSKINLGDLAIYAVGGVAGYALVDYLLPKKGVTKTLNNTFSKIPIVGSLWSVGEGASVLASAMGGLSFIFGLAGGLGVQIVTKDTSFGILGSFAGGAIAGYVENK